MAPLNSNAGIVDGVMWGERMAGDKEGCLKLVLLKKTTSENTALVLQCIFCITGY